MTLIEENLCLAYWEDVTIDDEGKSHDELVAEKFKYLKLTEYMVL